jgi:hypothetical protein
MSNCPAWCRDWPGESWQDRNPRKDRHDRERALHLQKQVKTRTPGQVAGGQINARVIIGYTFCQTLVNIALSFTNAAMV